jgi:hypothetical protein
MCNIAGETRRLLEAPGGKGRGCEGLGQSARRLWRSSTERGSKQAINRASDDERNQGLHRLHRSGLGIDSSYVFFCFGTAAAHQSNSIPMHVCALFEPLPEPARPPEKKTGPAGLSFSPQPRQKLSADRRQAADGQNWDFWIASPSWPLSLSLSLSLLYQAKPKGGKANKKKRPVKSMGRIRPPCWCRCVIPSSFTGMRRTGRPPRSGPEPSRGSPVF